MKRDLQNPDLNSLLPDVQVDRRGFVAACIAAGFAVAADPVLAQAIKTPMDGLEGGDIKIGELWKLPEIKEVVAGANQLSDEQAFKDLDATVAWAAKHARGNADKLGITGFCRGGRMVWMETAHEKRVKAGVAWYGGLGPAEPVIKTTPLDVVDTLSAPVLGLYGGADQGIPQEQVENLREALKKSKDKNAQRSQIHVYPDMPHGFNADYRPSYRKEAAADGWKRMLAWFKRHGVA